MRSRARQAPETVPQRDGRRPFLGLWRGVEDMYAPQLLELNISAGPSGGVESQQSSTVFFFWRGISLPKRIEERLRDIAEINFSIVVSAISELDIIREDHVDFISWHIAPVISLIQDYNMQKNRSLYFNRLIIITYLGLGLMAVFSAMFWLLGEKIPYN